MTLANDHRKIMCPDCGLYVVERRWLNVRAWGCAQCRTQSWAIYLLSCFGFMYRSRDDGWAVGHFILRRGSN